MVLGRPRVLVVDNHDSYTANLAHLVAEVAGALPEVVRNDELDVGAVLGAGYSHLVISPGPGHPADPADIGGCLELIRRAAVPLLGVCLGHQGIALAFGGTVGPVDPAHGVLSPVRHDGTGLFAGLPQGFAAVRYHSLAVTEVPPELVVTARGADGLVLALRHRQRPLVGVQFHPESVLTAHGRRLMANFLAVRLPTRRPPPRFPGRSAARRPVGAPPAVRRLPGWVPPESVASWAVGRCQRWFWLDSSAGRCWSGRFSYLGWLEPADLSVTYDVANRTVTEHRVGAQQAWRGTAFDYLAEALRAQARPAMELPFGFCGGWVGYLGYECKADTGGRLGHRAASPDACLLQVRRFLAFDHQKRQVYAVSLDADAPKRLAGLATVVRQARPPRGFDRGYLGLGGREPERPEPAGLEPGVPEPAGPSSASVRATMGQGDYRRAFAAVQRELRAGNTYELNLTYQVGLGSAADPFAVYRLLRRENPTPYAAFFSHPGVSVLSSSPERFLSIDATGVIEVKPIKGTTPRGRTPAEDAAHSRRLTRDPRFRSENLMIVDLVRNDVGLVSVAGTVQVPSLMAVESYAAVHQLVSTVRGTLAPGVGAVEAARALFPPGSMTGAPKERTMAIIDAVETTARGVYSGVLGWFGVDGRAELSVVIRTLVHHGDHYRLGTGGGITVYSDAASEYAETQWKSDPLIRAVTRATTAPATNRLLRTSQIDC